MKKVLIFPAGTEIAFEIFNALKYSKFVKIYGGTSVVDHSEFLFENLIRGFPYVNDPRFIEYLNNVIDKEGIDCVYPAHDSVGMLFSKHILDIHAQVIISDYHTVKICRSKAATYEYFKNETFIPKVYYSVKEVKQYPVFVKPDMGQGSKGVKKINSKIELEIALQEDSSLVISEYLPGEEYTIDCFTDRYGCLRVAKLRSRERIRMGISVRSQLLNMEDDIKKIAEVLNQKLKIQGVWFFQVKKNMNGEYRLLEVSPRVPGTMGITRNSGMNLIVMTLFDYWGYDVNIIDNEYDIILDRAFYSAYKIDCNYDYIYLDFDDTLVVNKKVNLDLIKLLYQEKSKGKKIILLSKHKENIYYTLRSYAISEKLFETIIVISDKEEKSDYIKKKSAIFIDDSFAERKKVHEECRIPVFDLDMIEALMDWTK